MKKLIKINHNKMQNDLIKKLDKELKKGDRFLTPDEASAYLPWTVYKVRQMARDGVFGIANEAKGNGVRYVIRLSEIRDFLTKRH